MKLFHVFAEADHHGVAAQLAALGEERPLDPVDTRVCVLGRDGPLAASLRGQGVPVDVLPVRRIFPLTTWRRLHHLLHAFRPNVIHAWDRAGVRAVHLAGGAGVARVIATCPDLPRRRATVRDWFDRWLLGKSHRIVTHSDADRSWLLAHGMAPERLPCALPGVAARTPSAPDPLPDAVMTGGSRWVVCAGRLNYHQGSQTAVWAFDILCFLYDRLQLLMIGEGPDRSRVERFASLVRGRRQIHLLGDRPDAGALMAQAEVVWALTPSDGAQVALTGMAAGRPVIAVGYPAQAEIITSGETGLLVPPDQPSLLARITLGLLQDPARAQRLAEAGQRRALDHFTARRFAQQLVRVYKGEAA